MINFYTALPTITSKSACSIHKKYLNILFSNLTFMLFNTVASATCRYLNCKFRGVHSNWRQTHWWALPFTKCDCIGIVLPQTKGNRFGKEAAFRIKFKETLIVKRKPAHGQLALTTVPIDGHLCNSLFYNKHKINIFLYLDAIFYWIDRTWDCFYIVIQQF